jgi:hypothetical protein
MSFSFYYKSPDGGLAHIEDRKEREKNFSVMPTLEVRFQGMEYNDEQLSKMSDSELADKGIYRTR